MCLSQRCIIYGRMWHILAAFEVSALGVGCHFASMDHLSYVRYVKWQDFIISL